MYFKRLEMHGFKSFAEPVIIEFHEGITCVVGPNGSGKSNISDAIRWVLGEQSPKALRGGKMEEVIFSGTASRKSRGMAEVTLVIDNSSGILDIDYNEVAITRRMFRSGESEYLINNNQCRLRDIRELIMDTGIGVDGYSLIGQGKISDIVSNKPDSRREIFEEAAGVVMYKSKKAETERKLSSTNNNLERINDIIGEIEGRIDGLREDSIKAKEYLELKERSKDLDINITLKNIENINSKEETYRNDVRDLEERIRKIAESKKTVDDEIDAAREKNQHLEHLGDEARDKLLLTVESINQLTNQSQLNEERLAGIEKDHQRLNVEINGLRDKLTKEVNNGSELEEAKTEILGKHKDASLKLQEKILIFDQITKDSSTAAERIDAGKDELFRLHNVMSTKSSEAKSIESFKDTLTKRKQQLIAESSTVSQSSADNHTDLASAKESRDVAKKRVEELTENLANQETSSNQLLAKQREVNLRIEELKIEGSQKTSRKKTIEEMENNYEGYNFAVKYMMKAGVPGIEGVVAELMEVPSGFEVAIETALGAAMQNIICDNDQNAKKAINVLKEQKAGRLTFLPVASIRGHRVALDGKITNDPGYKGIGSDCIGFDGKYQQVFDYLLGRVVIVDYMDTAIKLSKIAGNGIRFVTMDGEIINASGAITGGKYKNKTANLLERKSEIANLEQEIQRIRQEILTASETSKSIKEELERLLEKQSQWISERREAELELNSLTMGISSLENAIKEMETSNDKFTRELSAIDKEMADADKMIEELTMEAEKASERIEEINREIEAAMADYEAAKEVVSKANEEITATRIVASEWEGKKENVENLLGRINESIEDYRFQIEEKEKQLVGLDDEKNQILFGTGDAESNVEALLAEKASLEEYIETVKQERATITERINTISKEQQSAGESLNAYQDQKYQLEIKMAKNETQLETLKERLWEDFEISFAQAMDFKREDFVMSTSVKESRELRNRIRELGEVNVGAIKEYETVNERYGFLTEQRTDVLKAVEELRAIITEMDTTIKTKFKENFDQVVVNFEDIFKELFGGGHAELRMEDEHNPLESGIEIIAQPPGKKLQNINLMSGGEKTMTAIALMFAVLKTKPTPFCILDEVEAALDDNNIERFAKYLRKFSDIQFTLVTHQKATMEHADVLYGVTMPEHGISKVLSLRLGNNFEF